MPRKRIPWPVVIVFALAVLVSAGILTLAWVAGHAW